MFHTVNLPLDGGIFALYFFQAFLRIQPDTGANANQPLICIVLPQNQAVLTARSHHAVRLLGTAGHEIIDQRANIPIGAIQNHRRFSLELERGIDAGDQTLCTRFFIAGGAVKLTGAVQTVNLLGFQRRTQLQRVNAVVLNGIRRTHDLRMLQALDGVQHIQLYIFRHGGGEALNVHFFRV